MRSKLLIVLAFVLILNISMISAEIMFSQNNAVYNIGDLMDVSATLKASSDSDGFFSLSLNCNGVSRQFYLSPSSLLSGQQEIVSKKLLLSREFLGDMNGNCKIEGSYESEYASSQIFQITDKIDLSYSLTPVTVSPGKSISIKGTAIKANSQNLEGFAEIIVDGTNVDLIIPVVQGKFDANFSMADNAKSGEYSIFVKAYDKSGNQTGNQDTKSSSILVKQEPRKLEIIIDKQDINPGENIKIKTVVYDQAGDEIQSDVKIDVKDNAGNLYLTKAVRTNEDFDLGFENNAAPGYWTVYASSIGLASDRYISIAEFEKAEFEVVNDTLIISNIGNVPYQRIVQVRIGEGLETKDILLDVGEIKEFKISAPDGNYDVSVTDGSEEKEFSNVQLTGNAVSLDDIGNQINIFSKYPLVWLFLIIVLGLFVVMITGRVSRRKFYGTMDSGKSGTGEKTIKYSEIEKNEGFSIVKEAKSAEHSLVMDGKKEEASVLALKIKNSGVMKNKIAKESVDKAADIINRNKGSLYQTGENIIGIFAPSLTKSFRNDLTAVKVASEIASSLNEHNRKFKEKIDFGMGIHSGEIASKIENEKLKFTALGNTLNMAKRIADSAKNDVLLSKNSNNKVSGEVKTDKSGEYYSIKRIVDREQHKNFLDNFLKRN